MKITKENLIRWGITAGTKARRAELHAEGERFTQHDRFHLRLRVEEAAETVMELFEGGEYNEREINGAIKAFDTLGEVAGTLDALGVKHMTHKEAADLHDEKWIVRDRIGVMVF